MSCSLITKYDDKTLEPIPPTLTPGEKKHILLLQDDTIIHTNEGSQKQWLKNTQQPLKQKGNGHAIHIVDWICEPTGQVALSPEQVAAQAELPEATHLNVADAQKIIYPSKNHNAWWDLDQLIEQTKDAIDIFEHIQPGKVGIWIFDCSSAHEGLAPDTLNVNNMNINPGRKQKHLHTTVIPTNNPPPKPGQIDTQGMVLEKVFPDDHPDSEL